LPRNFKSLKVVDDLEWKTKNAGTTAKCKTKPCTRKTINLVFGQYDFLIGLIWILSASEAFLLESPFFRVMVLLTIQELR
jgi:hypothetical protein